MSLRKVVKRALRSNADVVIFDRYHYDELANLGMSSGIVRAYVRLILWLVPPPNVAFLLDADPMLARARKPEYPVDFLHTSRASYLNLARLAGMTVIAPQPIEDVERETSRRVLDELSPTILSRKLEDLQGRQSGARGDLQGSLGAESGEAGPSIA
jgi:thymidylate kinase